MSAYSVDAAPRWPELKLSMKRTQRCSRGTVVPPEVMHTTPPLPAARDRSGGGVQDHRIRNLNSFPFQPTATKPGAGQETRAGRERRSAGGRGSLAGGVAGDEVGEAGGEAVAVAERRRGAEEGLRLLDPARRGLRLRGGAWIHRHDLRVLSSDLWLVFSAPHERIWCGKFKEENERERDGTALIRQQDEGFWNRFLCLRRWRFWSWWMVEKLI